MDFNGHVSTGLLSSTSAAALTFFLLEPLMAVHIFVSSMIFSLYPDLDTGSISRRVLSLLFTVAMVTLFKEGYTESAIGILILMIAPNFFKHRGFTHTIFGMIFFVGVYYVSIGYCMGFEDIWPIAIGGVIGYSTHLISDVI